MPVIPTLRRAAIVVALTFAPSVALADAYDAAFARAIAAKERALDERDPARWEEALDRFQEADRLRATKEGKYELASAAARLRQDDLAVDAYRSALELGLDGPAADKAKQFIADNAGAMAQVEVVAPSGAVVSVRGRRRGVAPVTLAVFAGDTRLEVAFDGKTLQHPVHAEAGKSVRLDLTRAFAPKAPPSSPSIAPMPKRREPSRTPPRSGPPPAAWPLVIGGGGVALAGTLTALLASSSLSSHRDTLSSLCAVPNGTDQCTLAKTGQRAAAQDEVDAIATQKAVRIGGFVGLGVGAAAAITGVTLLVTSKGSSETVAVGPGPGTFGIGVHGTL